MSAQETLIQAASILGIRYEDLSKDWAQPAVRFVHGTHQEVVFEGNSFGSTPLLAVTICNDLPILRHLLGTLQIPCPKGMVFKLEDEQVNRNQLQATLGTFWEGSGFHVCRPAFDLSGAGVASRLGSFDDLVLHLDIYADEFATWIVEEPVEGEDLQLLAIGGRLASAILWSPVRVLGNDQDTLEELIEAYNNRATTAERVEIDAETRQLLRDQGVYLSEKVPQGMWVQLKNAGSSGGATDVTSRLHARYQEWIDKIAQATGLQHFTMQVRTQNIEGDPQAGAAVMRVDAKPDWMAFQNAEGNKRNYAALLLQSIFAIG